jgi:Glycosyl hydrolase family 65, N-terminal domain
MGGRPVLNVDLVTCPTGSCSSSASRATRRWLRQCRAAVLSPRAGHPPRRRRARAALPRSRRPRDRAAQPALRQHGRRPPGGHRVDADARNWSGRVEVITALDGRVTNRGVARYQELEGRHLDPVSPRTLGAEVIALKVQTRQSNLYIAEAARTRAHRGQDLLEVECSLDQTEDYIQQVLTSTRARASPCAWRRWSPSTPRTTAGSTRRSAAPANRPPAVPRSPRRWNSTPAARGRRSGEPAIAPSRCHTPTCSWPPARNSGPPEQSFVIEDADAGVQPAKAGKMAAIGLARADDEELLTAADADLVVTSLDDVDLVALAHGRIARKGNRLRSPRAGVHRR